MGMENSKTIQSVVRAMAILECVAAADSNAALGQISSELALNKSTVHGIAATLEHLGYLARHPETGRYALGLKVWELGQSYVGNISILHESKRLMVELVKKYQDTSHLAVLSDTEALFIHKIDCSRTVGIRIGVGTRTPAYCTGVGKALLAAQPPAVLEKIIAKLSFAKYTEKTITTPEALREELEVVRTRGFSMDCGEYEVDLRSIGAPIFDHAGQPVAAVSLAGSAQRFSSDRIFDIATDVRETARRISEKLGYQPAGALAR